MDDPYQATPDVHVLPTHLPLPGVGVLPINAYVLHAEEPVLVDTGLGVGIDGEAFIDALRSVIDPTTIQWVWLTHDDADHTGNIQRVMEWAPNATLVTHAFNALRMTTWWPVPLGRVRAIAPGDTIDLGDRTVTAVKPPLFDNPMSTGLLDGKTGTLFSVDSFGAILPEHAEDASAVDDDTLAGGLLAWATFDSPWAHLVDRGLYAKALADVEMLAPRRILSSHLPPATGRVEWFLDVLGTVPDAEPSIPLSDEAFQQLRAHLEGAAA